MDWLIPDEEAQKILLVDDEDGYRDALELLFRANFPEQDIVTCKNAEEACAALNGGGFDIIVTDMRMPNADEGLQVVDAARRTHLHASIIVMTAYGGKDNLCEAIRLGADQYLYKDVPNSEDILIAYVTALLPNALFKRRMMRILNYSSTEEIYRLAPIFLEFNTKLLNTIAGHIEDANLALVEVSRQAAEPTNSAKALAEIQKRTDLAIDSLDKAMQFARTAVN